MITGERRACNHIDPSSSSSFHALSYNYLTAAELSTRQIEYATLVDKQGNIVLSPNNEALTGTSWNPAGLVAAALKTKKRYSRIAKVAWKDLQVEVAPIWHERVNPLLPTSALHPNVTHASALMRYTATPVWIGADKSLPVDGVLISGGMTLQLLPSTQACVSAHHIFWHNVRLYSCRAYQTASH